MTKLERLAYWKEVAKVTSPEIWIDEYRDLFGYFQRFRPHGDGLAEVFKGVVKGAEILERLLPFFDHTSDWTGAYFVVASPVPSTESEVADLVRRHLDSIREIANEAGDDTLDEVESILGTTQLQFSDTPIERQPTFDPDSPDVFIYDVMTDWFSDLEPVESEGLLLREAAYSMTADYFLSHYALWPLYADATTVEDPFAASFQLWIRGVSFAILDQRVRIHKP